MSSELRLAGKCASKLSSTGVLRDVSVISENQEVKTPVKIWQSGPRE